MSNVFEELMSQNRQLSESIVSRNSRKVNVSESKKIKFNKIKLESRKIFEEEDFDELDKQFAIDPEEVEEKEDEVVLVIDPEVPYDEEVPEDAAEKMIGDFVYKCPVCGGNYVCNCDAEKNESVEVDEDGVPVECPICGDDSEQILIGEIAPVEDAGEETEMEPADVDDAEDSEEFEDEFEEEDEEVIEDSVKRGNGRRRVKEGKDCEGDDCDDKKSKKDKKVMKEDVDDDLGEGGEEVEFDDYSMELETPEVVEDDAPAVEINANTVSLVIDESKLEKMLGQVIKENYKSSPKIKVNRVTSNGNKIKVEYLAREGKKSRKGVMIGEGFSRKSRSMRIRFKDKGVFTESYTKTPAFIVDCVRVKNTIIPTKMSYNYKVKVNESLYRVYGKVGGAPER